jgi:ribosomal protein S18 acetylase RimI-like enzyme
MDLLVREMRPEDAESVIEMVRGLAQHVGNADVPKLTAQSLNSNRDLIDVAVAEQGDRLIGACLTLMTFSTWRGVKGLYVVDLFVEPQARGNNTGLQLLKFAAARGAAHGAQFIKLEVDHTNERAAQFYERLGFVRKSQDRLFILESDQFRSFVG